MTCPRLLIPTWAATTLSPIKIMLAGSDRSSSQRRLECLNQSDVRCLFADIRSLLRFGLPCFVGFAWLYSRLYRDHLCCSAHSRASAHGHGGGPHLVGHTDCCEPADLVFNPALRVCTVLSARGGPRSCGHHRNLPRGAALYWAAAGAVGGLADLAKFGDLATLAAVSDP